MAAFALVAEKIVREPVRKLRHQVRSGRRHNQDIVLLRDADMFNRTRQRGFRARIREEVRDYFAAGQRGQRQRRNEFLRGTRQNGLDRMAALNE
jgi:hypothetical protein